MKKKRKNNTFWNLISENPLISALIASIIGGIIVAAITGLIPEQPHYIEGELHIHTDTGKPGPESQTVGMAEQNVGTNLNQWEESVIPTPRSLERNHILPYMENMVIPKAEANLPDVLNDYKSTLNLGRNETAAIAREKADAFFAALEEELIRLMSELAAELTGVPVRK